MTAPMADHDAPAEPSAYAGTFCGRCGEERAHGEHLACDAALALEPPRYCTSCRRRMVVQVVPTGWTAHCVEHGDLNGGTALGPR